MLVSHSAHLFQLNTAAAAAATARGHELQSPSFARWLQYAYSIPTKLEVAGSNLAVSGFSSFDLHRGR